MTTSSRARDSAFPWLPWAGILSALPAHNRSVALSEKLDTLPLRPGVYLFKDAGGQVLYVGKARVLRDRVRSYFQASRPAELHKIRMVEEVADLDLVVTDTEMEALALENNFIKRHKPPYNVRLRDDKNHPYLKLTLAEEYPRLYVVRRPAEDGNVYGGPYIPASLGRKTSGLVHKLFGIRSCKEALNGRRPRPCLQYQINRCLAPCVAEVCSLDRYRQSCEDARLFLEGRTEEVVKRLRGEMEAAAAGDRFEEAASLRDQVRALERLETPQKITTTELEERDLFGVHAEGDRAAVQAFSVRDGKVVAREGFLLDRLTEPETVLATTIQQFYAAGRYVPRELLVAEEVPDRELLEQWLSQTTRDPGADPHAPAGGEAAPARARGPKRQAGLRPGVETPAPAVPGDPARPAGPARPRGGAAPHRVFRHLEHPGLGHRGVHGGLRGRPAQEVRLPQVPDQERERRPRRFRLHARGGGPALPAAARGGEGPARPRARRRGQGPARGGRGGPRRAGPRRPAPREPGQAGGAHLRAGPRRAHRLAAQLAGIAARAAGQGRGPPLRRGLPPQGALGAHDPLGARRHPGGGTGQAARAALALRLGPRRAGRERGRAGKRRWARPRPPGSAPTSTGPRGSS